MSTITCRIPEQLDAELTALARRRRVPKAVLIREALTRQVRRAGADSTPTAFQLGRSLCGSLRGPEDLSTNPAYLDDLGA